MILLIVNYHYLRDQKTGRGIHPISTSEFISHMDLKKKKYKFIYQSQLISFLSKSNEALPEEDICLLTFDDGLKEQLKAFNIQERKYLQFFISTMPLDRKKGLFCS